MVVVDFRGKNCNLNPKKVKKSGNFTGHLRLKRLSENDKHDNEKEHVVFKQQNLLTAIFRLRKKSGCE